MQEKLFDHDMKDILSAEHINWNEKFMTWARSHLDLCDVYTDEKDEKIRSHIRKRIEHSIGYGHQILNSMNRNTQIKKDKSPIPLSGMTRFSKPQDMYATHDGEVKTRKIQKQEHKEIPEARKPCLPSKTYVKKKKEN